MLVGAIRAKVDGERSGPVSVYERSDGAWQRQARLAPHDPSRVEGFGQSVALAGEAGRAYVSEEDAEWALSRRFGAAGLLENAEFGFDVAQSEDSVLVGAPAFDNTTGASLFDL